MYDLLVRHKFLFFITVEFRSICMHLDLFYEISDISHQQQVSDYSVHQDLDE